MISKESFCSILRALHESDVSTELAADRLVDVVSKARPNLDVYGLKGYTIAPLLTDDDLKDKLISILESEMEDTETGWITYFYYELEFGTVDYAATAVSEKDAETGERVYISLTTPEELYDMLKQNIINARARQIFEEKTPAEIKTGRENKSYTALVGETVVSAFDYDGPSDKLALQAFTGMYFSENGEYLKGTSAHNAVSVRAGDTIICSYMTNPGDSNRKMWVVPRCACKRMAEA